MRKIRLKKVQKIDWLEKVEKMETLGTNQHFTTLFVILIQQSTVFLFSATNINLIDFALLL